MEHVKEKRAFDRYPHKFPVSVEFAYDAETKVKYQVIQAKEEKNPAAKIPAVSKNICASGLCFTSDHKLRKGQSLHLEVYLPDEKKPIHMDGQVRWSNRTSTRRRSPWRFDTGVKLNRVEGKSVESSVYFDKTYHVYWSNVLESIFGTFRKLRQKKTGL